MDGARQIRTDQSPNEGLNAANTRAGGVDADVIFTTMFVTQDKEGCGDRASSGCQKTMLILHMFQVTGFPIQTLRQGFEDAEARAVPPLGDLSEKESSQRPCVI